MPQQPLSYEARPGPPVILYERFTDRFRAGAADVLFAALKRAGVGALAWAAVVGTLLSIGWARGHVPLDRAVIGLGCFALIGAALNFVTTIAPREFYLTERGVIVRQTGYRRLLRLSAGDVHAATEPLRPDLVRVTLRDRRTQSVVLDVPLPPETAETLVQHLNSAIGLADHVDG